MQFNDETPFSALMDFAKTLNFGEERLAFIDFLDAVAKKRLAADAIANEKIAKKKQEYQAAYDKELAEFEQLRAFHVGDESNLDF